MGGKGKGGKGGQDEDFLMYLSQPFPITGEGAQRLTAYCLGKNNLPGMPADQTAGPGKIPISLVLRGSWRVYNINVQKPREGEDIKLQANGGTDLPACAVADYTSMVGIRNTPKEENLLQGRYGKKSIDFNLLLKESRGKPWR